MGRLKRYGARIAAAVAIAFAVAFPCFYEIPQDVYAATRDLSMDYTDVMRDLESSTIEDKQFDLKEYGFNEDQPTSLLFLAEYCYSFYSARQMNYNLLSISFSWLWI